MTTMVMWVLIVDAITTCGDVDDDHECVLIPRFHSKVAKEYHKYGLNLVRQHNFMCKKMLKRLHIARKCRKRGDRYSANE